jgi:GNAT superfamily N-acetyltransferase
LTGIVALSSPTPIEPVQDLSRFSCGKSALDNWLRLRALSNHQKGFTAVLVVHEAMRVVGYYGLAPTAVTASTLPRSIRTGQPPEPVPCLLLGQLATDLEWSGKGVGSGLLNHALRRCVDAARLVGGRAVIVNAIDRQAAEFWARKGFIASRDDPSILLRPIAAIAASIAASRAGHPG